MRGTTTWASLSALAASSSASWLPTAPGLPPENEPRWDSAIQPRAHDAPAGGWPYGPFKTEGRHIVNARGERITWAGVNWPMNDATMIPEGLEWASVEQILDDVASVGFNFIRMPYAFEMVDEIYERGGEDVSLEVSLINALGMANGTRVTHEIIKRNPGWTPLTQRFEIWSDIVDTALKKRILIHPDLHVGKAKWCCSHTDGNAWFQDLFFPVKNWHRALEYVAKWTKSHPNIVSMSLRNELRESWNVTDLSYNWMTLVGNMTQGADTIHATNPDLLITFSGMQYDQDLSALTTGKNLLTAPCYRCVAIVDRYRRDPVHFDLARRPWADKLVWELHLFNTSEDVDTGTCDIVKAGLYRNGFNALGIDQPSAGCRLTGDCPPAQRRTPVIITEFGQTPEDPTIYDNVLVNCIRAFTIEHGVSWSMWSLAGSYRVRQRIQGYYDPKGLINYDWTGWNAPDVIKNFWKPWVKSMDVFKMS